MTTKTYAYTTQSGVASFIHGTPRRILEFGCSSGGFKENISWDCEYHGVDPCESACALAARKGIVTHVGTFEEVRDSLPDSYFDLVVCNHVIEHMSDPWAFLREVKGKMAPGAELIGVLPNMRHFTVLAELVFRRDWHYVETGILDNTHLRFFTRKSLQRLFEETGYAIEILRLDGNRRVEWEKRLLMPLLCLIGSDVLNFTMSFRVRPIIPQMGTDK